MASSTPVHDVPSDSSLDLDYIDSAMSFTPSERCTISCGTVCIDPRASKVLIIFNRHLGIWQLPKGRKNIGEDLQSAALRETYEETGVHADLAPLKICTRSTTPLVVRGLVEDAPRRGNDTTLHRANPSATSASSVSTAYSTSVASTPSSVLAPSRAPTPTTSNGPADGLAHGGYGVSMAQSRPARATADIGHSQITSYPANAPGVGTSHAISYTTAAKEATAATAAITTSTEARGSASAMPAVMMDSKLTCHVFNNELIGVVQYPDLQVETPKTIKIVFFFAAYADSTAAMGAGAQEDHEDLVAEWVDFRVAGDRLRFCSEKEAVLKVRKDMERSGLEC